jgi:hypothetical protein
MYILSKAEVAMYVHRSIDSFQELLSRQRKKRFFRQMQHRPIKSRLDRMHSPTKKTTLVFLLNGRAFQFMNEVVTVSKKTGKASRNGGKRWNRPVHTYKTSSDQVQAFEVYLN